MAFLSENAFTFSAPKHWFYHYVACSQTLYFLFKVRRARVIKNKLQGIY